MLEKCKKNSISTFMRPLSCKFSTDRRSRSTLMKVHNQSQLLFDEKKSTEDLSLQNCQKTRYNQVNIQMLPENIHNQVFPIVPRNKIDLEVINLSKQHLRQHDLPIDDKKAFKSTVDIQLPKLLGNDIEQHFWNVGLMMQQPYYNMAYSFANHDAIYPIDIGKHMLGKWSTEAGWTRYELD